MDQECGKNQFSSRHIILTAQIQLKYEIRNLRQVCNLELDEHLSSAFWAIWTWEPNTELLKAS